MKRKEKIKEILLRVYNEGFSNGFNQRSQNKSYITVIDQATNEILKITELKLPEWVDGYNKAIEDTKKLNGLK